MDLGYLVNILLKRKWLLISVVLISSISTFILIGRLPYVFKSKAVIATGIIDYKGVSLQMDNPFIQQFQIESSFNSLIEKMKSRTSIKLLTDTLLIHDVEAEKAGRKPFRPADFVKVEMTEAERQSAVMKLKANFSDTLLNTKPIPEHSNALLAKGYGYDFEALWKKLEIKRIGETDYLSVEFESENPELSFFVVNVFLDKFFKEHAKGLSAKEDKQLEFAAKQFVARQAELDSITILIDDYKKRNNLVDATSQREGVVSHIKDLELKLEESRLQIPALKANIASLEKQIMRLGKGIGDEFSNSILYRSDVNDLDNRIKALQDKRVEELANGRSTDAIDKKIEALKSEQAENIQKIVPVSTRHKEKLDDQNIRMIQDKVQKQLDLELAEASFESYQREIARLQAKANMLTINDNELASLMESKDRIDKEYSAARDKYELAKSITEGSESPLSIIEAAEFPYQAESKHRAIFAGFAGIAGGSIASIILFLLAFIDSSLQSPSQFQRITRLPLLGYVNKVKIRGMNLNTLFSTFHEKQELEIFKENIRKIRTAIEGSGAKCILFTSPKSQEGKSFLVVLLAYALSLNDKKILIIDTNFKNNTLSGYKTKSFIEITTEEPNPKAGFGLESGQGQLYSPEAVSVNDSNLQSIDIVANKGGSQSPAEVLAGKNFKKVIEQYSRKYDFIFMEAASMNMFSDARELLPFADKVVAIMSAESPIGSEDKDTLEFLRGLNGKMLGGILNKVDLKNI
jgi:polysaccharide biosynthesis transport protein